MREILCITHKYPPTIGGMEKQSFELIAGLSKYYKIHVIAYQNGENKVLWFSLLKSKIETCLKENPNIKLIHLNDGAMAAACLWLQKYTDIPIVATYHGLDITFPLGFFQNSLIPKMRNYNAGICVSAYTREQCLNRGFDAETTRVARNGVDTSMGDIVFDPAIKTRLKERYGIDIEGKNVIITTGRAVKRKGFSWFLRNVMPRLDKNIVFLMIGPLGEPTFSQKAVNTLPENISSKIQLMLGTPSDAADVAELAATNTNVHHLGSVPYKDLVQLLSIADLFVMPNIHVDGDIEGFGLVALEASIRKTFVLASGIEGITDAVIDGENGIHMPSGNADAWINKIHELLQDKTWLKALSEKACEYTRKHYSWGVMVERYREIFEEIMEKQPSNR